MINLGMSIGIVDGKEGCEYVNKVDGVFKFGSEQQYFKKGDFERGMGFLYTQAKGFNFLNLKLSTGYK